MLNLGGFTPTRGYAPDPSDSLPCRWLASRLAAAVAATVAAMDR